MKKIGIYGGTFDPIHYGHLLTAQNALEEYNLDKVLIIPSGNSYLKSNVTDSKHRLEMAKLAIENDSRFELSTIETDRLGNSYSYETIQYLKTIYPDCTFFFIVGADTFVNMSIWKSPDIIFANATIIVAYRDGFDYKSMSEAKLHYENIYKAKIIFMKDRKYDISSSEIRERVKNSLNINLFLPENVLNYICDNDLYK